MRHNSSCFALNTVDEATIAKAITSIKTNAEGIDAINMDLIIQTLPHSLKAITHIINKSIQSSRFPHVWKIATVDPIPKNSDPADVTELRPISILPCLSKVLERVMYNQVSTYCEANDVLPSYQSGFRRGHSTNTALLDVVNNIICSQDGGKGTLLVLLDFSRAFDCINIPLMLAKLFFTVLMHRLFAGSKAIFRIGLSRFA